MLSLRLIPLKLCLSATLLLACGALWAAGPAADSVDGAPAFSAEDRTRIAAHGPWPPPAAHDPSNAVSGNVAAIEFGRRLFHEPRFSVNGYVACIACHQTGRAYTDGIARARGLAPVERNTPSVLNAGFGQRFGWLGTSDSLWMASLRPLLDQREMASSPAQVAHVVRVGDGLACEYRRAFGRAPEPLADETLMLDVAKALAAFQETLVTGRTTFDDFRDALTAGPQGSTYPAAAQRGALLFVGKGACAACHAGANFTDGRLVVLASASASASAGAGAGTGTSAVSPIKVPTLRNVAVTAPYLHDGSLDTLQEAVRHGEGQRLGERELEDLVAFLHTLTDAEAAQRTLQRPGNSNCR